MICTKSHAQSTETMMMKNDVLMDMFINEIFKRRIQSMIWSYFGQVFKKCTTLVMDGHRIINDKNV